MKKYICLALCLCMCMVLGGCKPQSANPIDKNTNKIGKLSNNIEFIVADDNSKVWLDNSHIEKISLQTDDNGVKTLIFSTTEEGKTALFNATNENIGKPISVVADEHLLFSPIVMAPIEDGKFTFSAYYLDGAYLFNHLTGAKDKMEDVAPPDSLITEEDAKSKMLQHANLTADSVSEYNVTLKIDEDYFGWKYLIDFTYNGKNCKSEINAHTGTIIKFYK